MEHKKLDDATIIAAVEQFEARTRRQCRDVTELASGAVDLLAGPDGWRLEWRRSHTARTSRPVTRYKIPAEILARESQASAWRGLVIWLAVAVTKSARAVNGNAGRSRATLQRASHLAIQARTGERKTTPEATLEQTPEAPMEE